MGVRGAGREPATCLAFPDQCLAGRPPGDPAAPPSEDPRLRGTRRREGVQGCPKAPGRGEFLMVPESLSLGQVSSLLA